MDTLTSIQVFRQIVDSGSFTRAAERLDISTGMVSKHLMHIERRLGLRLLNRNSRSLSLTEPGRLYLERCTSILEDLQAMELELGSRATVARGTLRVSAPSSASERWLADLLAQYRRREPEVVVDLSFEDRFVNLVDEGYDLALRITSGPSSLPPGLIARPLRPVAFYLAASRDYLERRGAPASLDDLTLHDFLAVGNLLDGLPRPAATDKRTRSLRIVLRYRSLDGVANAVAAGIGIAPLPALAFEDPAFRDVLIPVLTDHPLQLATLYAVYSSGKLMPPKLRSFVDFLIESMAPRCRQAQRTAAASPVTVRGRRGVPGTPAGVHDGMLAAAAAPAPSPSLLPAR